MVNFFGHPFCVYGFAGEVVGWVEEGADFSSWVCDVGVE